MNIRAGDTHHGHGSSRAIDMIAFSRGAVSHCTIHNGIHCIPEALGEDDAHGGATVQQCRWPQCMEYTRGDHFLMEASIEYGHHVDERLGCLSMPRWWHDGEAWRRGLNAAEGVINFAIRLLQDTLNDHTVYAASRKLSREEAI